MIAFAPRRRTAFVIAALAVAPTMMALPARADDFALSVSPPRFELSADPGQTARGVVELANASTMATELNFATAEWNLAPDGGLTTANPLKLDSCRPWVAIERKHTVLAAKTQLRYRFEVTPPPGTAPTECRFAIVISGAEERVSPTANVSFPVAAQIALIVYVKVGDVKPQLRIVKADVVNAGGMQTPVLMIENTGAAHGRLSAFLTGIDAKGKKREFTPSTLPILPGETRMIALNVDNRVDAVEASTQPKAAPAKPDPIDFPLKISGTMNDSVSSFKFDGTFEP